MLKVCFSYLFEALLLDLGECWVRLCLTNANSVLFKFSIDLECDIFLLKSEYVGYEFQT